MLACLLPCVLFPCATQETDWLDRYLAGHRAIQAGELPQARSELQAALALLPRHGGTAWQLACASALAGDTDAAFSWLERAVEWSGGEEALLGWDPDLARLRADPRFEAIRERLRARDAGIGDATQPIELAWRNRGYEHSASTDAESLVVSGAGTFLWDRRANELVAALDRPNARSSSAQLSPDGRWVVVAGSVRDGTGNDNYLRVFDASTGDLVRELDDAGWLGRIEFDSLGKRMLAYGARHTDDIDVFETNTWRAIFKAPRDQSRKVLSPDGAHLLILRQQGSDRSDLELWDVDTRTRVMLVEGLPIQCDIGFSRDGGLVHLLVPRGGTVKVYDVARRQEIRTIESLGAVWTGACLLGSAGHLATVDEQDVLHVWDARSGEPVRSFPICPGRWSTLTSSPDGSLVLATDFYSGVTAYETSTGRELWSCEGCAGTFPNPRFTPEGSMVVAGRNDGGIEIREARSGRLADAPPDPGLSIVASAHPLRDEIWLGVEDGSLRRVDASTGTTLDSWTHGASALVGLSFAADGSRIVTIDDAGVLRSIRTTDGEVEVQVPQAKSAGIDSLGPEFGWRSPYVESAPDGGCALASGPKGELRLFSLPDGRLRFESEPSEIFPAWSWSPDSKRVALVLEQGRVTFVDTASGARSERELRIQSNVCALAFEPDGKRIWVGDDQSKVHVFDAETGELVRTLDLQDLDPMDTVELGNIVFRGDGELAITTSSGFGVVAGWDPSNGSRRWDFTYDGGNPASLLAALGKTGERLYVWGQGTWSPRIVDAKTGGVLLDLGDAGLFGLIPLADERRVGGLGDGLEVFDAETGARRWTRIEARNGQRLLRSPSGHVDGTRDALERIHAILPDHSYPLDALAAVLLDPKRVRAAADGCKLRTVRIPPIPSLAWAGPVSRVLRVKQGDKPPRVTLQASCAEGVAGFELLLLGKRIRMNGEQVDPTRRRLTVQLEVPDPGESTEYRWRAIGTNGLLSRALRVAVETEP